jgi:hypothetical protein
VQELPRKIVTLWEIMQKIFGAELVGIGTQLMALAGWCRSAGATAVLSLEQHVVVEGGIKLDRNIIATNIESIQRICKDLGLSHSQEAAFDLVTKLRHDPRPYALLEAATRSEALVESIRNEMMGHLYLTVPQGVAGYYDKEKLLGDAVFNAFPEARHDVRESGNCLACDNNTAAVFHLMRVAEHGLRNIAKKVGIKLIDKGKPQPIEYATWDKVITAINNKIIAAQKLPQGPRKSRSLQFHADAAENCSYIKEWRNETSHTRTRYNCSEATSLLIRVRDFMCLLAERKP